MKTIQERNAEMLANIEAKARIDAEKAVSLLRAAGFRVDTPPTVKGKRIKIHATMARKDGSPFRFDDAEYIRLAMGGLLQLTFDYAIDCAQPIIELEMVKFSGMYI